MRKKRVLSKVRWSFVLHTRCPTALRLVLKPSLCALQGLPPPVALPLPRPHAHFRSAAFIALSSSPASLRPARARELELQLHAATRNAGTRENLPSTASVAASLPSASPTQPPAAVSVAAAALTLSGLQPPAAGTARTAGGAVPSSASEADGRTDERPALTAAIAEATSARTGVLTTVLPAAGLSEQDLIYHRLSQAVTQLKVRTHPQNGTGGGRPSQRASFLPPLRLLRIASSPNPLPPPTSCLLPPPTRSLIFSAKKRAADGGTPSLAISCLTPHPITRSALL